MKVKVGRRTHAVASLPQTWLEDRTATTEMAHRQHHSSLSLSIRVVFLPPREEPHEAMGSARLGLRSRYRLDDQTVRTRTQNGNYDNDS